MLLVFFWKGWQLPLAPTFVFMLKDTVLIKKKKEKKKRMVCSISGQLPAGFQDP